METPSKPPVDPPRRRHYVAAVPKGGGKTGGETGGKTGEGNVITLSHWRAALARARTQKRAQALLELPDVERVVPTLPVQDLYYAVKEIGLADAAELLALASPAQVRGFIDLDAWDKDRIDPERLHEWLDALIDLGPDQLGAGVRALDVELPSLWLARCARVYDLSLGEAPPEDTIHPLMATPDGFFLIEITTQGEAARTCERLIDHLYRADQDLARRVVQGAHWELPSELEEASYRWRSGRMADLGFVDYYDALEIYRPIDPHAVRIGEGTAEAERPRAPAEDEPVSSLPAPYADSLAVDTFFHRAVAQLTDAAEVARIGQALVALANRVMAAEQIDPAELEAVRATLERALGTLSIGLEYVAAGDLDRAAEALRTIALSRLFRVGTSVVAQLGRLAATLIKTGRARLEAPWEAFVTALAQRSPRLQPPGAPAARSFREVADVRLAAGLLEQASWQGTLVRDRLGFAAAEASFADLVRTAAANLALGRAFAPAPLARADLGALRMAQLGPGWRADVVHRVRERAPDAPAFTAAIVEGWLRELEDERSRWEESPDPRFVSGLLVRVAN